MYSQEAQTLNIFTPKPCRDTSETFETSRAALLIDTCAPYAQTTLSNLFATIWHPVSQVKPITGTDNSNDKLLPVSNTYSGLYPCVLCSCYGLLRFISGSLLSYVSHCGMWVCQGGRQTDCMCVRAQMDSSHTNWRAIAVVSPDKAEVVECTSNEGSAF